MSRRGGGWRPDPGRDQHPSSPAQPYRGGRGGGRGRGRGGDAAFPPPVVYQPRPAAVQQPRPAAVQQPRPAPATAAPPAMPHRTAWGPSAWRPVAGPPVVAAAPAPPRPVAAAAPAPPRPVVAAAPTPPGPSTAAQPAATAAADVAWSSTSRQGLAEEFREKLVLPGGSTPASVKALVLPPRPGYGTVGMKCLLRANHFLTNLVTNDLRHYDVTITPEIASKKKHREIINLLVRLYRESHLGNKFMAYDGMKGIYTAGRLPFESKEFEIKLVDENVNQDETSTSSTPRRRKNDVFKVMIRSASRPDIEHLRQFIAGRQRDVPSETIQALDVVLRHIPSWEYTVVGSSLFDLSLGDRAPLGNGVEYWRGYYQSLRPTQMGLSLNVDVGATSFYEPILVTEFLSRFLGVQDFDRPIHEQDRIKLKKALRSVKVIVDNGEFIKTYKIIGMSTTPVSATMFKLDGETRMISVAAYFQQRYQIRLRHPALPAIQAGTPGKSFYLPMELCRIVEGQRYTKRLNERQVTALLRATCQRPRDREGSIRQIVENRCFLDSELVQHFGVDVQQQPVTINARVLNPPMVNYQGTGPNSSVRPQTGQWNMINKRMVNGGRVDHWTCLNFSNMPRDFPHNFCKELVQMCVNKGMVFNPNPIIPIRSERPQQIEKALSDVHYQATRIGRPIQLLFIILPDRSGFYGTIKRICETELGIVTQCAQPKAASRLSKQYLENLSLKVNVKVGGRNSVLNDCVARNIPLLTDKVTIIFGADVTHGQPGEASVPSIAAVVASMDWPEVTKYRGVVSAQKPREEIILDLYNTRVDPVKGLVQGGMIRELIYGFKKETGLKPERILFYRDGVSDGQFSQVLLHEVDAIRKACISIEDKYLPPITFVTVQKRHHTRLFPNNHNDRQNTDRSGNILPGTVVDTQICHPTQFDFYLNSHAGIQGTSRPAHYHVLFDENNFTADEMQVLTNNLCYTYVRCTRSVSIVPPAYYAHLAAFRARYYMEDPAADGQESWNGQHQGGKQPGGGPMSELAAEVQPLPKIKENVKNVMFYC